MCNLAGTADLLRLCETQQLLWTHRKKISVFPLPPETKYFKDSESIIRAASGEVKLPVSNAYFNLFLSALKR